MRFVLAICFFFCLGSFNSQNDTLQQVTARGKKQGYWKVFLDSNARKTDSSQAYFIAYEYYHEGKNAFDFYDLKWKTRDSAVFTGLFSAPGHPILLNGKFTWFDKKNQMITFEENYENGHPTKFKEVRYKKKKGHYTWAFIRTHDFSKRYHGVPGSYYIQEQNNQAIYSVEEWANFWYRDGKRGWRKYRIKSAARA
jgi:hypothetical protein